MKKRTSREPQKPKTADSGVKRATDVLEKLESSDDDTDVMHIKSQTPADRTKAVKHSLPKVKDALQHIESKQKADK